MSQENFEISTYRLRVCRSASELPARVELVRVAGFEPATLPPQTGCSTTEPHTDKIGALTRDRTRFYGLQNRCITDHALRAVFGAPGGTLTPNRSPI